MKNFVRKFWLVMVVWRKILGMNLVFRGIGVYPISLRRLTKIPRFYSEFKKFVIASGTVNRYFPILHDYNAAAGSIGGCTFIKI